MIPSLSAREWNDAVRQIKKIYPVKVLAEDGGTPNHVWKVTPSYRPDAGQWEARLTAGSVNGQIAVAETTFGLLSDEAKDYLRRTQPSRSFSDTTRVRVPLDFGPAIRLGWRQVGGDAQPIRQTESGGNVTLVYEPVPQFFLAQGVPRGGQTGAPGAGTRRLYACDIVLRQPRTFLANEISILPGGPLGGSILSVNPVSSTPQDSREPARVVALSRFSVPPVSNTFADIFFQRFQDEPTDELHLSTVYALSPSLEEGGSFPAFIDDSFSLQTRYYCHYNLAHATRTLPRVRTPPLTLVTGLAAGLGDVMFNFILSAQNDFAQSTLDLFNQRSLRGSFWVV